MSTNEETVRLRLQDTADKHMAALLSFDAKPERLELRASSVPEAVITSLYSYEFSDLVPGLMLLLHDGSLEQLRDSVWMLPWSLHNTKWKNLTAAVPTKERLECVHDFSRFLGSDQGWQLHKRITSLMPRQDAANEAENLITALHAAHWYMLNPRPEIYTSRVHACLIEILTMLFPDFVRRAQPVSQYICGKVN